MVVKGSPGTARAQVSICIMFAKVTLAKASHKANPRSRKWKTRLHRPMGNLQSHFTRKEVDAGRERICGYFHNLSIPKRLTLC